VVSPNIDVQLPTSWYVEGVEGGSRSSCEAEILPLISVFGAFFNMRLGIDPSILNQPLYPSSRPWFSLSLTLRTQTFV